MSNKYTPRSDDPWDKEKEDDLGEKEEKKPRESWFDKIKLSNLAEPTVAIAIVTATFYIFISGYYISYYQRLSIQFYTLDLPFTFYLYSVHWILYMFYYLIVFLLLIIVFKDFLKYRKLAKGHRDFIILAFILFAILIVGLALSFNALMLIKNIRDNLITLSMFLFTLLIWCWIFFVLYKEDRLAKKGTMITYILFVLVMVIFLIPPLGVISAEDLIRGDKDSLEIKLVLKDENPDLSNRTLILVTHNNKLYYLVEKNGSVPERVNLYVIPDDQIKLIKVARVGNEQKKIDKIFEDSIRDFNFFGTQPRNEIKQENVSNKSYPDIHQRM